MATTMTIPPEIVDQIIDHAHDDTKTLTACSLTAKDWVPSTRLHLFKKLSLLSAHEVARFTELDRFAPDILCYCQELSVICPTRSDTPRVMSGDRVERFTSLHTLHFRGFSSGVNISNLKEVLTPLLGISERIITVTITNSSLESCHDLWNILRLFPNLKNVHVSDLGYSSNGRGGLFTAPGYRHSPSISSFSLHTYCQGFVLEQLAEPPYPLTHLRSLEIHHTGQKQQHLHSIATKYQDAITTLKFSACATLGSDIPPHIGMYNRLRTLILGKLELFTAYSSGIRPPSTDPSFAWVTATMPCIKSRLTRLVFEIAVTERHELNVISWEDIDSFLGTREQFKDLKTVEVVFLGTVPTTVTQHPEMLRLGIDLKEEVMKRMPTTVKRGLMKCLTRGLHSL